MNARTASDGKLKKRRGHLRYHGVFPRGPSVISTLLLLSGEVE